MTIAAKGVTVAEDDGGEAGAPRSPRLRWYLLHVGIVAVAASPIVVGALSLIGDTWYPANDWAAIAHRVAQVGTTETPLVGPYSRGSAHPGPLGLWLGAPLYRLTGGDTRSLAWSATLVNVAALVALAAVAWRRGRWPLFLAVTALAAVLVRGFGPVVLVDLWNPFLPLLAFALTIFLVWDAALGRRGALVAAVVPASLAMQSHLGFVPLVGLLVVWLFVWVRWWSPCFAGPDANGTATSLRALWDSWRRPIGRGLALGAVLWLAPLIDAVFGVHNPWYMARSSMGGGQRIGLVDAVGLVGRYVRPDGPWMGGVEPLGGDFFSIQGSGPLPVLFALAVLAGCLHLARRRGWLDVAALGTLAAMLVVGAVPAVLRLPLPAEAYLIQWLKAIGALVWFTVAWAAWRLVEPAVRSVPARRRAAVGLVGAVLVAAAGSQWGAASTVELPTAEAGRRIQTLYGEPDGRLPRDGTIRVVQRGDHVPTYGAGLFYVLAKEGYDVVTDEGARGLKWGQSHRWQRGEDYDMLLTVAVGQANQQCELDSRATLLGVYDLLSAEERAWLSDVKFRLLEGADAITPAEARRSEQLGARDERVGVYEGPQPCAKNTKRLLTGPDESALPVVGAGLLVLGSAAGWFAVRRRRVS